jgi:F-type H+-transporting ATPase subunit b
VRSVLAGSAIAAILCLGSAAASAQDEPAKPADTAAPASGEAAAQPVQRKVRRNKYTDYWAQRAGLKPAAQPRSVASAETAPQPTAAQAKADLPNPAVIPPSQASMDAGVATLDGGIDGAGLDSLPGIAAAHEAPAPVHPAPVAVQAAAHAPAQAEHGSSHGANHEAGGQHGEHAKFSPGTFALQLLNFGVLLFLLIYFGGKAMNKSLRARHEQLKAELAEAARLREEAQQKAAEQGRRLTDLEKELSALRASLWADAEREQARMLEGAQERAKRIQEEMRFQIDQQVKEAELLLRAEVANASVKLAEQLVRKSVDPLDQRRLAQEFVAGFDGQGTPTGGEG